MKIKEDVGDVIEIYESKEPERTNRYLNIGWVLLGVFSVQYSESGYSPLYSLGWLKSEGEIKHPEKTEHEIYMENLSNNKDIPF